MYKVTLGIDGMMCGMCEAHVNDTLRKAFNPKKVNSSHKKNTSVMILKDLVNEEEVRQVLDPTGYRLTSFMIEPYEKKGLFK